MSSHSQFKKFNILHELEQAIKKKTQEKYAPNRSKSRTKYTFFHEDPQKICPLKTPFDPFPSNLPQKNRRLANRLEKTQQAPIPVRAGRYLSSSMDVCI